MCRSDFTKFGEKVSKLSIIAPSWESLNINVEAFLFGSHSLVFALILQNLNLLATDFEFTTSRDGLLSNLRVFKLDIAIASALVIWEEFNFAGFQFSKFAHSIV